MNTNPLQLLKNRQNGRHQTNYKIIEKRQKMNAINEKVKRDSQNMTNIQYMDIGKYPIEASTTPSFNSGTPGSIIVNFSQDTEDRLRHLEIKQRYSTLSNLETRELIQLRQAQNRLDQANQAEQARTQTAIINQAGGLLRKLF